MPPSSLELIAAIAIVVVLALVFIVGFVKTDPTERKLAAGVFLAIWTVVTVMLFFSAYLNGYREADRNWNALSTQLEGKRVTELTLIYPFGEINNHESENIQNAFSELTAETVPVEVAASHSAEGCTFYTQIAEPYSKAWGVPLFESLEDVFHCENVNIRKWTGPKDIPFKLLP